MPDSQIIAQKVSAHPLLFEPKGKVDSQTQDQRQPEMQYQKDAYC